MIDLHLHTTASDGRLTPEALVARAAAAGIAIMSVTDHDTVAGLGAARQAANAARVEFVDGIEVTSVFEGRDVHVLGYFIDPGDVAFASFLETQRAMRVNRAREIGVRLQALGTPVDVDRLLARVAARPGTSAGRPAIAKALVEAGHVESIQEAFDRFLATGRPAFVPRVGKNPSEVLDRIHAAGGLVSLAHPGVTNNPTVLASLVDAGLDAVEAFHSDHSAETQHDLLAFAAKHRLLVTGGSDFHGDDDIRDRPLGGVTLPSTQFDRLRDWANTRG